jgi:hypothetical protein
MIPHWAWWCLGLLLFVVSTGWFRANKRLRRRLEKWQNEGVLVYVETRSIPGLVSGEMGGHKYQSAQIVSIFLLGMYIDSREPGMGGRLSEVSYTDIITLRPASSE